MLPRATHTRGDREAATGQAERRRTQEIQRLIGRSLRAVTDMTAFGERQVVLDCDVLQADGGTRTAAITGAYVALHLAFQGLVKGGVIDEIPLYGQVAAISCGLYQGAAVLDLDYAEDSNCQADANFVLTTDGQIIEIQGTAEDKPFAESQFLELLSLAKKGGWRTGPGPEHSGWRLGASRTASNPPAFCGNLCRPVSAALTLCPAI